MNTSVWPLILAGIENFVLINALLSVAAFGVAAFARTNKHIRAWHPLSLSRLYAAALILPPAISAWVVSASLLPAAWIGTDRWVQEHQSPHTLHLLNALTFPLDPLLGYVALSFALLALMIAAYAGASAYFRVDHVVRRLEIDAEPPAPDRVKQVEDACRRHGINVGLVMSHYPFSFVWGYLRSKLVISTGLLNTLTREELSALLEHEAAHHARRDNLSKWVLTICRYASPAFPLTGLLYRWWAEQVEMICDEIAALRTKAPVDVAGALARLKRLTLATLPHRPQSGESRFFGEHGESFERRVTRVLSLPDQPEASGASSLSRSWMKVAAMAGAAFVLSLIALFLVSPLAIHRAVEFILYAF
ncbi:MAG: M56 family metallopeptidase [Acidobacteriota bacterium]